MKGVGAQSASELELSELHIFFCHIFTKKSMMTILVVQNCLISIVIKNYVTYMFRWYS